MAIRGSSLAGAIIPLGGPAGTPGASTVAGLTDASADLKALNTTRAGQRTALGVDQVTNTADKDKPVSTAQQAALNGKQGTADDASGLPVTPTDAATSSLGAALATRATKQSPTLNTATLAGLTTHGDKVTAPASSMALSLASQPTPNYGSDLMQGGSKRAGAMEFFRATDINVTHGASDRTADANAYKAAKVGDYVCLTATATAGDCYAFNGLVNCQAGHPGAAITFESDLNDYNVPGTAGHVVPAYTLSDIASGAVASPIRCHFYAAGLTQGPMSAVFLANFSYGYMKAKRVFGIYGPSGSVAGPIIESNVAATALWTVSGTLTQGFDLSGATLTSNTALKLPNSASITWAATNAGPAGQITYNPGNLLFLTGALVVVGASVLPQSDNALALGSSSSRFTTIYSVNGTSSSSDAELKDDIADLPGDETFDLVMALAPKSWRWKVGGKDKSEVDEACEVQANDPKTGEPIFDIVPVIDPNTGKQAVKTIPARDAVPGLYGEDATGERVLIRKGTPAVPAQEVPLTTQAARMVPGTRKVPVYTDRPGKRVHAGYVYQEVEATLAAKAVDYGICDRAENGGVFLRMERFTPLLHRAFQIHVERTQARLTAIEAKLGLAA
ncbi:tail fiber domain-containing protein [Methylobacterium fujisawaense]|uniref:tail fiber domain-containing protein n=1 Tax=Methylobacterium fujisawaense TaxID=107400 RepID=UPI003CEDC11D